MQRVVLVAYLWLTLSAFDFASSLIPETQIIAGGPPKDGIPALTLPKHEPATIADLWLKNDDLVLGVKLNGQIRAYPIRILNWHEIVNDRIGNHPFVISYCPLCGSGMAFDSADYFGVSGLLYQSDVLLYDKRTESLWSQLKMQAVTGERSGERLKLLPVEHTTWASWKARHPDTRVLSRHTGFFRDYNRNPYAGYESTASLYFPITHRDNRLPPKTWVLGLSINNRHQAWVRTTLLHQGSHTNVWQGVKLDISVDGDSITFRNHTTGNVLPVTRLYWFAWAAFHPDTELAGE